MAYNRTRIDVISAQPRPAYEGHSVGYAYVPTVGPAVGAVHLDEGMSVLAAGGSIDQHLHSNEEAFYVVAGTVDLILPTDRRQLSAGHYGFVPVGTAHAWRNPGDEPAQWIEVAAPQAPTDGRVHTIFLPGAASSHEPRVPDLASPLTRHLGWWASAAHRDPFTGEGHTGMDVGITESPPGVIVKQLVNAQLGAMLVQLIMCEFAPGVGLHGATHDHCYEESYVLLDGTVTGQMDGRDFTLQAGDAWWVGVGTPHTWHNDGATPTRWIEAQCPQPPRRHSYRWTNQWETLAAELGGVS
jgi:mannose-6-phosphate isomerase-like protein (cupin superfamily)